MLIGVGVRRTELVLMLDCQPLPVTISGSGIFRELDLVIIDIVIPDIRNMIRGCAGHCWKEIVDRPNDARTDMMQWSYPHGTNTNRFAMSRSIGDQILVKTTELRTELEDQRKSPSEALRS